ncbi:cytoskeleton protein RodZ [Paenibacillus shirakamiensis]|uniref:Cytoskeleton protein RodZ n=1 Tax=Paenibacillus shirakamiensis TaxID=1265935 RepID=A0ABS4JH45_9BACL|nr:RodZ domain-containing protein [Paenibacillus shirakamiensis]MBP2001049.1 cytoskeleton protein RodZ [Paenibacillus shirakamiensis]
MSDLGQQLKEARLQRGLSLDDVQDMTKIRKRYLEAIEAGDYKVLPGSFYVRAFIKTYAEAVGVEPDGLLEEHRKDVPIAEPEPVLEPVMQKRRSTQVSTGGNSKWLSTVLMFSFALLIVVVIYIVISNNKSASNTKAPDGTSVTTNDKANDPKVTDPVAPSTGVDTPSPTPSGGGTTMTPGQTTPTTPAPTTPTTPEPTTPTPDPGITPVVPESGAVAVTKDGKKGSTTLFKVTGTKGAPVKVEIKGTGKSWVEVRRGSSKGEKLFFDFVDDGTLQSYDLDASGLYIKSGSSSHTQITVAGQSVDDGKNTTRVQLNLSDSAGTNTESGTGTSEPEADTGKAGE